MIEFTAPFPETLGPLHLYFDLITFPCRAPPNKSLSTIALTHHGKWDGSGYPQGLKANQIPLAGRIVALADGFNALTSERPYKKAFPIEKAHQIISRGSGQHFDPDVVEAFFAIQDEILRIGEIHQDEKQNTMFCFDNMLNEGAFSSIADCTAV